MNIKKGDTVIVRKGKDAGKKGTVVAVLRKENKVVVDGLNMKKRHMRAKTRGEKGQMIDMPHPIARPNVALAEAAKKPAAKKAPAKKAKKED